MTDPGGNSVVPTTVGLRSREPFAAHQPGRRLTVEGASTTRCAHRMLLLPACRDKT